LRRSGRLTVTMATPSESANSIAKLLSSLVRSQSAQKASPLNTLATSEDDPNPFNELGALCLECSRGCRDSRRNSV
jgi:hypothetical protein